MSVGERLRKARETSSMAQAKLSELSGVSEFTISRIEGGVTEDPRDSTLEKLAAPLKLTLEELRGPGRPTQRTRRRRSKAIEFKVPVDGKDYPIKVEDGWIMVKVG